MREVTFSFESPVVINLTRGQGTLEVNLADMPESIIRELVRHGLQQKVADSCADKNKVPDEAVRETSEGVVEQLLAGVWAKRGGGGRKGDAKAIWLKDQAETEARKYKSDPRFKGKTLKAIAEMFLASQKWNAKMEDAWKELQANKADLDEMFDEE